MIDLNRVTLLGRAGRPAELRATQTGDKVATLSLATTRRWRRAGSDPASADWEERTEWHRVAIFGPLAEIAGSRVATGTRLFVEGEIRTREYTDREGQTRRVTEVVLSGPAAKLIVLTAKNATPGDGGPKEEKGAGESGDA